MRDGGGHSQDRQARLATALRDNLRRRKAQQRGRAAASAERTEDRASGGEGGSANKAEERG